jgi:hypothetical protein
MTMIIVNLATPKAAAKQELMFDKPAKGLCAIKFRRVTIQTTLHLIMLDKKYHFTELFYSANSSIALSPRANLIKYYIRNL